MRHDQRGRGTTPAVRVHSNAAQTLTTGVSAATVFGVTEFDTYTMFDGTSTLTIPKGWGGIWLLSAGVEYAANATGVRQTLILRGTPADFIAADVGAAHAAVFRSALSAPYQLIPGDTVTLTAFQTSGGNLALGGVAAIDTFLAAVWLGPR